MTYEMLLGAEMLLRKAFRVCSLENAYKLETYVKKMQEELDSETDKREADFVKTLQNIDSNIVKIEEAIRDTHK